MSEEENPQCAMCEHDRSAHIDKTGWCKIIGCACGAFLVPMKLRPHLTAADILEEMAKTYRERNAIYGDNYRMVGPIMAILFPNGVSREVLGSDQFHLFELKIVKLTRFAISNLTHLDSIHDDAVYSAMIESILRNQEKV